jgi:superfamily II DNA/RNA helicase
MPAPIKKLADKFLTDPKSVEVARPATANTNIEQKLVETSSRDKRDTLRQLLQVDDVATAIIFSNRKTTVRELATSLKRHGFAVGQIHGDMEQPERLKELDRFKTGDINILVASDVAARGLDIKGVSHVFNYDVPWHPDDYVHRIGRTGRAGRTGKAFTLVTSEDAEAVANIEKLTGQKIERIKTGKAAPAETLKEEPAPRRRSGRPERSERVERPQRTEEASPPRRERSERSRRDDRGSSGSDGPDEGWNGPIPAFLEVGLPA